MATKKPQKPRQGWVYMLDLNSVHICCTKCRKAHWYEIAGMRACKESGCDSKVNVSHVQRGTRPYLIWTANKSIDANHRVLQVIPLTTSAQAERFKGLSDVYPVNPSASNGLTQKSFALVNQLTTIDSRLLKRPGASGHSEWKKRMGQLSKADKAQIAERIRDRLLPEEDDWFTPLIQREHVLDYIKNLPEGESGELMEELADLLWK